MKNKFDWNCVWLRLQELAAIDALPGDQKLWRAGQEKSVGWIAEHLQLEPGVLIADEVGLGKTRLAIALAVCVVACGGRVAIMIPPGLTYQWCDEELRGFLNQLRALNLQWMPLGIPTKVLRTYPDMFGSQANPCTYPISKQSPIVFLSHRFGLPQRLGAAKQDESWALPFALKLKLVVDGRKAPGAAALNISWGQQAAVNWLGKNSPKALINRLLAKELGVVSPKAFSDSKNRAANETLFRNVIGELIGDFELVIIDEAHKNRLGADSLSKSEKQDATRLQSRMTACLNEILLRPGSKTLQAKRVALTATPMEMNASQWLDILCRLGLNDNRVNSIKRVVNGFSEAVNAVQTGSTAEVLKLEQAAMEFQDQLGQLVTRRLWRDHPEVQRFAALGTRPDAAHPHRRTFAKVVSLSELTQYERLHLAYAEGLAIASKGMITTHRFKSAGSRHSQGLPLLSEVSADFIDPAGIVTETLDSKLAGTEEQAKRQRQAYWINKLKSLSDYMGQVGAEAKWNLQWHPKVRHAVELIESLTEAGRKVLVFGEFVAPLRALDRALNIRHFLRHVRNGKPIPVPTGVNISDPDVTRWLNSSEMNFSKDQITSFPETVNTLSLRYTSDRAGLRKDCGNVTKAFFKDVISGAAVVQQESMDVLITWLVQQLCTSDNLSNYAGRDNRDLLRQTVLQQLASLKDVDPVGRTTSEDAAAELPFNWESAICELKKDIEEVQPGKYVFRMSPFSQLLFGETKPATRRVRQSAFNNSQLNPQVLIGQSAVASEGLNLHRACRSMVLFHLDWNPGRIEQQIGRIDRQDSAWMVDFGNWNGVEEAPFIDIHTITLDGTYDALRCEVVHARAKVLRSQLFGEIVPLEQLSKLNVDAQEKIGQINIDFRPSTLLSKSLI